MPAAALECRGRQGEQTRARRAPLQGRAYVHASAVQVLDAGVGLRDVADASEEMVGEVAVHAPEDSYVPFRVRSVNGVRGRILRQTQRERQYWELCADAVGREGVLGSGEVRELEGTEHSVMGHAFDTSTIGELVERRSKKRRFVSPTRQEYVL